MLPRVPERATVLTWACGCGSTGTSEAAAQRHVKDGCTLMGRPAKTLEGNLARRYWLTEKGEAAVAETRGEHDG